MATTAGQVLTLDEFLAQPEVKPAREFVCGEVWKKPMPTGVHAVLQAFLLLAVQGHVRRLGFGFAGAEWRVVLGPPGARRSYVPDILAVSSGRLAAGGGLAGPLRAAPELVIEILSPRQSRTRLTAKITFYLRHGVRLLWLVDPRAETVTVFAPGQDAVELSGAEVLDGGAVLPGFALPVRDIWAELAQT